MGSKVVLAPPSRLWLVGRHRWGAEVVAGGAPAGSIVVEVVVCHQGESRGVRGVLTFWALYKGAQRGLKVAE